VLRLVRVFTRFEAQNILTRRKLDMLCDKPWRERVLKELGGMRKLRLWEAAKARIEERAQKPRKAAPAQDPSWLYTPDRIAESERLKARVRACAKACAPERVVRDRVKVDFEGEFRLAPLPRGDYAARQVRVYTAASITDYDWNPIPFDTQTGFGPATVWPVEFYAAMAAEAGMEETQTAPSPVIPHHGLSQSETSVDGGSNFDEPCLPLDPPTQCDLHSKYTERGMTEENAVLRDDRLESVIPIRSAYDAISPKLRKDIFGGVPLTLKNPQEAPLAGS